MKSSILFFVIYLSVLTCALTTPVSAAVRCVDLLESKTETLPQNKKSTVEKFSVAALQKTIEKKIGEKSLYQPLLSSDMAFLRNEVAMAEGPSPQKNMRIVPPAEQFRITDEVKAMFDQKKRLIARNRDKIIGVLRGEENFVRQAVIEQFEFIFNELPEKAPQLYKTEGNFLINLHTGDRLSARQLARLSAKDGLEKLGQFVPDDLIFMKKFGDEYRIAGGNLAFPTNWNIKDFLGASISDIHSSLNGTPADVAAFSRMINGVLDRTLAMKDVVARNNWFLQVDPRYALPNYLTVEYEAPPKITQQNYHRTSFLRTERQSLRGMPESKMVVFGIRPYVFPLGQVMSDRSIGEKMLAGIRVKLLPDAPKEDYAHQVSKFLEKDLLRKTEDVDTEVIALDQLDSSTYMLTLKKPEGLTLIPGEAVLVTLDTKTGKHTRTLSLASSPNAKHLQFAVKSSDSDFKIAFKDLKPNNKINLQFLRSSLDFDVEKPIVMIAGGIGITPFRSFIQYAHEQNINQPMWLFYANKNEIPFHEELNAAMSKNSNLQVTNVLSQPGASGDHVTGRIDREFLKKILPTLPPDAKFYIVATSNMTFDLSKALIELGVPENRILFEGFIGYENGNTGRGNPEIDPVKASNCQTICFCHQVNAGTIRTAINNGASTLQGIKIATKAATGCGGCAGNVGRFLRCEKQ